MNIKNMTPRSVYTYLYNLFHSKLSDDMIYYLVPFYIKQYECRHCLIPCTTIKQCIHCKTNVCDNCTFEKCTHCGDNVLCKGCMFNEYKHFTTLLHDLKCDSTCLTYKLCNVCAKDNVEKCGWCFKLLCPQMTQHDCILKYNIVKDDIEGYKWLNDNTNFSTLFDDACKWYHKTEGYYEPHVLYEYIQGESLEEYLKEGNDVDKIPDSIYHLLQNNDQSE